MKRKLITQMRNEWRSNIWLIVELTIAAVIIWYLAGTTIGVLREKGTPGYFTENLYTAAIERMSPKSDLYTEYPDSLHNYETDLDAIIAKVKQNPYVKEVGIGGNAMPYDFSYWGNVFEFKTEDSTYIYYGNTRYVTPELMKMLKIQGLHGETPEDLAAVIAAGNIIMSKVEGTENGYSKDPDFFVGKDIFAYGDSTAIKHVGASAYAVRRSDYEIPWCGVIYMPADRYRRQFVIEIYPGKDREFTESLTAADMAHGNVFLSGLHSLASARESAHSDINRSYAVFAIISAFLMVLVFLGFLGTFWFRIQQRTPEIAIRMVNGATRADIFRRFASEGFLLLIVPLVLACLILLPALDKELVSSEYFSTPVLILSFLVMTLAMSLMILAGIWVPARKAMTVKPAEALKDQ